MAIFVSAATLAGAFGGILAFAIQHMNGWVYSFFVLMGFSLLDECSLRGLHGWSWIFLLEGVCASFYFVATSVPNPPSVTVICALVGLVLLPDVSFIRL
jgi:hypothetical protein